MVRFQRGFSLFLSLIYKKTFDMCLNLKLSETNLKSTDRNVLFNEFRFNIYILKYRMRIRLD